MGDEIQSGVSAQDVELSMPELVKEQLYRTKTDSGLVETGEYKKMVNYTGLIPYLIEAVKEQQQTIESLQQRIEALEAN
jgi:hypothetical protein